MAGAAGAPSVAWRALQATALVATVALVGGLLTRPETALGLLWNLVIPLLPASFLVSPGLWRNVCPLATLNMLTSRLGRRHGLSRRVAPVAGVVGIVLLVVMVPARRLLFNVDGPVLAATIVAVGALALTTGLAGRDKAGFCNAICPVLPVERLYGQSPLLEADNPRCAACSLCVANGCLDLAPHKSMAAAVASSGGAQAWLRTSYGAFAAAFPGFVVGYYTTEDVALGAAGSVYLHVAAWAVSSYVITVAVVWASKASPALATGMLAATAAGLYYWFAAPLIASALGLGSIGSGAIRLAALGLVAAWLWRGAGRDAGWSVSSASARTE